MDIARIEHIPDEILEVVRPIVGRFVDGEITAAEADKKITTALDDIGYERNEDELMDGRG